MTNGFLLLQSGIPPFLPQLEYGIKADKYPVIAVEVDFIDIRFKPGVKTKFEVGGEGKSFPEPSGESELGSGEGLVRRKQEPGFYGCIPVIGQFCAVRRRRSRRSCWRRFRPFRGNYRLKPTRPGQILSQNTKRLRYKS